jgi:hypothetical protein
MMVKLTAAGMVRHLSLALWIGSAAFARPAWSDGAADALLAIDQHRASVIEKIVTAWGPPLALSSAQIPIDELRTLLEGLRADHLLAASLAGTLDGVRDVLANAVIATAGSKPSMRQAKSLGDMAVDDVYTPVTPCRLVDTRGTFAAVYQGNGTASHTAVPFTPNQIRTYAVAGGNGVCLSQLPASLAPSAVQLQVFGMPTTSASGDIEILPAGGAFGTTATMVYVGNIAFNTVSTTAKINLANNQIGVQVRGGGAHVAIDVVGYFKSAADATAMNFNVNGQRVVRYEYNATSPNVIGGHPDNTVGATYGQTIGGGGGAGSDCYEPSSNTSTRPCRNRTAMIFGTIGGGEANQTNWNYDTVGGGRGNTTGVGGDSTIAGGVDNTTSGVHATIGGGLQNKALSGSATVAGGAANTASGDLATISGGQQNSALGAGGAVAGGFANTITGNYTAIPGGAHNEAAGSFAIAAGGEFNSASGNFSFAAGHRAKATRTGSFIWADSRDFDFLPSVDNFFGVRATGGVGLTVAIDPTTGGVTQFCNLLPGVPSWQCTSDANAKENFVAADGKEILRRLVAMPIASWSFKGADPTLRSLGPTAQDFFAAFGLGHDDKSIATSNLASVALAAIQGLHRVVEERNATIERQYGEISALRDDLQALRLEVGKLKASTLHTN